jgi:hypothetical protein
MLKVTKWCSTNVQQHQSDPWKSKLMPTRNPSRKSPRKLPARLCFLSVFFLFFTCFAQTTLSYSEYKRISDMLVLHLRGLEEKGDFTGKTVEYLVEFYLKQCESQGEEQLQVREKLFFFFFLSSVSLWVVSKTMLWFVSLSNDW